MHIEQLSPYIWIRAFFTHETHVNLIVYVFLLPISFILYLYLHTNGNNCS